MNGTVRDACGWPVVSRNAESQLDSDVRAAMLALQYLDLISYPLFLLLAIVGNTLNLTILCADRRGRNNTSKTTYLSAIAFCDLFYMLWSIFNYIPNYDGELNGVPSDGVKLTNDRIAGVVMFFQEALAVSSAWLIVAFSVERFVAIKWPLKHLSVGQEKRSTLVTSGILFLAVLFTVIRLIDYYRFFALYINLDPKPARKPPRPPWLLHWLTTYLYSQAINQVLTFLTILILDAWLLKTILRQRRKRRDTLQVNVSNHSQNNSSHNNANTPGIIAAPAATRSNKAWSTLPLLAACVILYLVTQVPTVVDHVIFLLEKSCTYQSEQHVKMLLNPIQNILLNINHSVNFVLYCGVDERFRRKLWKIANVCLLPITSKRRQEAPQHQMAVGTVSGHTKSSSLFGSIKSLHLH